MKSLENSLAGKNIYLILGFARSGTSTIARSLKALGVDLGENFSPGNQKWNPKGFFEDREIVYHINAAVFSALEEPQYSIRLLAKELQTTEKLAATKTAAITLLKQRFSHTQHWGFKDPSTAKILGFWQDIFAQTSLQDHYIFALRHPLASAKSYQKVTGTPLEVGLLLWLMHLVAAIDATHARRRVMVSYELMMHDPKKELERIRTQLRIPLPLNPAEIEKFTQDFLDKKLNRHGQTEESAAVMETFPLCMEVYQFFLKLARDEVGFDDAEFRVKWQRLRADIEKNYPAYCYIDTLLQKNKRLEKDLKRVNKSLGWKMLYPLRVMDDVLRVRRERKRNSKRLLKAY